MSDPNQEDQIWALCVVTLWIFLDKKLFLILPLPSWVFNFVFKGSIPLGAIMKWWLAFHWVGMEKCWAKFLMMLCAAQIKKYSLSFCYVGLIGLFWPFKPQELAKSFFSLLYLFNASTREKVTRINKVITQRKNALYLL